jgi:uncharacterized protein
MQIFKTISLVLAVALTSMSGHGSLAQDFDNGVKAYKNGDFATALKEWRPLAEQGNAAAQFNLALMYDNGTGVPQDYAQAVEWYRRSPAASVTLRWKDSEPFACNRALSIILGPLTL